MFIPDPKFLNDPQDTVDWREKGYVVPEIGNQGPSGFVLSLTFTARLQCGSCWAFTATGSLEGQHAKKTGKLCLFICNGDFEACYWLLRALLITWFLYNRNNGCEGGQMTYSYVYVKKNNGIDTETSYPYVAKRVPPHRFRIFIGCDVLFSDFEGDCKFKKENVGATDIGFFEIKKDSEKDLQAAVQSMGPIGNAIDGTQPSFQLYKSGVYSDPNCSNTTINHSLLIVGYGTDSKGQEYWTCKNSWGVSWGNKGYVLIARNKNNMCGIAATASFPIV
ncbi:hypothetical protein KUTeg_000560 [Tegillarca granosa]|uniref:Peptidase C1A papain C-terminal domain-containing protein n=1 Tax=Tegillarca granosa TaxID=220873 RepID=A0ABQ9FXX0_TEGGR|nr:hypothetical protein KUTeg_000560 [Tegillarca granosa]